MSDGRAHCWQTCERGNEPSGFIQQWEVLDSSYKGEFCIVELVEGMA